MIKRLKYENKEEAIQHLKDKGVIGENNEFLPNTQSVVHLGKIIDTPAEYNEEGEIITEPKFKNGYHVDVMLKIGKNFGEHELSVDSPIHKWL